MTDPVLSTWQCEIDGLVMGDGTDYRLYAFDVDKPEVISNDAQLPRSDGIRFGTDFLKGNVVTMEFGIDTGDAVSARAALAAMRAVWINDAVRSVPGAVATLRYQLDEGETRRVYGRPRKFAPGPLDTIASGYVSITADFTCVDHRFYADSSEDVTFNLVNPPTSGMESPLVAPITSTAIGEVPGVVTVGGETPAFLLSTIHGPIINPSIEVVGDWTATFEVNLLDGETITVDPRPWARTVLRNGVSNIAGSLSASSPRISQMVVQPGTQEIVLRGIDGTGTSYLELSVTDTYVSL